MLRHIWEIWRDMWYAINSHLTAWLGYALIVLGFVFDAWPQWGQLLPPERRGTAYAIIGALVLGFRARRDIAEALTKYRELRAQQVPK
jgi:hypothetical protein